MENIINGRYILHEALGDGGMGIVYRATDRLTSTTVALKQVRPSHLPSATPTATSISQLRLQLAHEFQLLASLRHPYIISVLDYGFDTQQQPYFTMPYVKESRTILEAGKGLTVAEKVRLIQQLLQALTYLHRRDILHRDIKPENILTTLDSGGELTVQVLDFGLSGDNNSPSAGTAIYLAPELWLDEPHAVASDLFAVGVVATQLLAGHHPFGPLDSFMLERLLDKPPNLTGIDNPDLAFILRQFLQREPKNRYQTAYEALQAINQLTNKPLLETAAIRESYLQTATFVGREAEMKQLLPALAQTKNNHGSSWLIGGESGVGKSRLLSELRTHALVDGFIVIHGQGIADAGGLPYQLWRDIIRRLCLNITLTNLQIGVLQAIVPNLPQLLQRTVPPIPSLPELVAQQRLHSTLITLFRQQRHPILLLLEDLQWVQESLAIWHLISPFLSSLPVMLIGTYRDDERPKLPRQLPHDYHLQLNRLEETAVRQLTQSILGTTKPNATLFDLLQRQSEGNTFFLIETIRTLAADKQKLQEIGQDSLPETILPSSIQNIIQQRLARIPAKMHALLQLAAVAGRQLDLVIIRFLAQEPIESWLIVCADAALLGVHDNVWQFNHDKIREGILAAMDADTLRTYHRQVAQAIEQSYPKQPEYAATLMYHWHQAGDVAKERNFAQQAGHYAAEQYANEEAITFFTRAFTLTPPEDDVTRYELLSTREHIYDRVGNSKAQWADLIELLHIATRLEDVGKQTAVYLRQGEYASTTGQMTQASESLEQALTLAQATNNQSHLVKVYEIKGHLLQFQSDYAEAIIQLQQGYTLATQLGLNDIQISCLYKLGRIAFEQGDYDKATQYTQKAIDTIINDNGSLKLNLLLLMGHIFLRTGKYDKAKMQYESGLTLARQIGERRSEGKFLGSLAILFDFNNAYEQAYTHYQADLQLQEETGDQQEMATVLGNMGALFSEIGLWERSTEYNQLGLALSEQINSVALIIEARKGMSYTASAQNQLSQAHTHLQEALKLITAADPWRNAQINNELGYITYLQGNLTQSQAHYHTAYRFLESSSAHIDRTVCQAGLATINLALGDKQKAGNFADKAWQYIKAHGLSGDWRPFLICLLLYDVYIALENETDANAILKMAYDDIQAVNGRFTNDEWRQAFLTVPENGRIVALYEASYPPTL